METRNVKLTLEQAKEFYKKGGDLRTIALTAFTEEELAPLPKSWGEFCANYKKSKEEAYIEENSEIEVLVRDDVRYADTDRNVLPSLEAAKAHRAFMQLHQLRDCYRQGWVPDWDDRNKKYCIIMQGTRTCRVAEFLDTSHFLSFQSQELANRFLEKFVEIIYQARDLL